MTAKKMFEELGYKVPYYQKDHTIQYNRTYLWDDYGHGKVNTIVFYKRKKEIEIDGILNQKELQAINKQVEELGWYE